MVEKRMGKVVGGQFGEVTGRQLRRKGEWGWKMGRNVRRGEILTYTQISLAHKFAVHYCNTDDIIPARVFFFYRTRSLNKRAE